ncbi:MAG: hypothetical protein KAY24_12945, partial [Candidatus Eisenbacteria sp.]|nr:hypothetical protein [Candidatus Eisenbacteria bacterium]
MNCANHENVPAIATCTKCAKPLCEQCAIHWRGGVICKLCLESENLQSTNSQRLGKSPGLAALCSLMPGLGQIYVGYYRSGFLNILIVSGIITVLARGAAAGLEPFLGV